MFKLVSFESCKIVSLTSDYSTFAFLLNDSFKQYVCLIHVSFLYLCFLCLGTCGGWKKASDSLELELEILVCISRWMLGNGTLMLEKSVLHS